MPKMKISVITVVYNGIKTIERCITSVLEQNFDDLEYIVIDGASTDGTSEILGKYKDRIDVVVSEKDEGIYDAMNKGIALATGDIIGTLNADDFFADEKVLTAIAAAFRQETIEILYSDLDFVKWDGRVSRKWRSGKYKKGKFNWGWMPPHPTFYCRKKLFDDFGVYSLDYGSAADYELMLRFMHLNNKQNICYLDKVIVKMQVGGVSNKSLTNRVQAMQYDLKAMKNNRIFIPVLTILFKPLRKIAQFF